MNRFLIPIFTLVLSLLACASAKPVRVLIWDERQPRQAEAYDNFLGNEIAARLKQTTDDLEIRSVAMDDPEQGLSEENLVWAEVMIWWGHVRQGEIKAETIREKIMPRLKAGSLDLIILHSAHWSTPFMEAMNESTKLEARRKFPNPAKKKPVEFEFVPPSGRLAPDRESLVTPAYLALKRGNFVTSVRVDLPNCCFPAYRPDRKPSTMTVKMPEHPIAEGLPKTFTIPMTEMYDEPFHIPTPDEVVFEETWEQGERFRSGILWNLEKGQVFYFRPGHEQYPVFKQPEIIRILANACRWMRTK